MYATVAALRSATGWAPAGNPVLREQRLSQARVNPGGGPVARTDWALPSGIRTRGVGSPLRPTSLLNRRFTRFYWYHLLAAVGGDPPSVGQITHFYSSFMLHKTNANFQILRLREL